MSISPKVRIAGIRSYFPEDRLTNKDLEKMVETNDEWIRDRTGIQERRMAKAHETPAFMGTEAAKELLEVTQTDPKTIDLILGATNTADYLVPSTAALVQNNLKATKAFGFDVIAACSAYLYSLETARAYLKSGLAKKVLLIAAEKMSSFIDYQDRQTCIIFGDAGTATLLEACDEGESDLLDAINYTDGSGAECLWIPGGGAKKPLNQEVLDKREHYVHQEGRAVFKRAVKDMTDVCIELLERNHLTSEDIDLFVPHQANMRIIEATGDRLKLPKEKVAINISHFGNTTAATIPSAMRHAEEEGKLKRGDLIMLAAFGAGFTWGASLLRY